MDALKAVRRRKESAMAHSETSVNISPLENPSLDKNLRALAKNNVSVAATVAGIDSHVDDPDWPGWRFEIRTARNGQPTMVAVSPDSEIAIHSLYDPIREAADQVKGVLANEKRNYFVILGFGLGYAAEQLLAELDKDDKLLIVEPHIASFRLALETRDLSSLLTDPRVVITLSSKLEESVAAFIMRYNLSTCTGVGFIECAGRTKLPSADLFAMFIERLKGVFITMGGNLQTLMLMAWSYQKNTMGSMAHIVDHPPVRTLFNAFEGKPAIIVSAGPSLAKNIGQIKELINKAVIVACDTSLRPLLKAGVEPHLVCTGDPQEANWKHLRGTVTTDAHLVAEPMTYSASLELFKGRLFIASYEDKVMKWLEKFIPPVGHTLCWGSVATMAFDLARKMGCNPIIFVGQDLSFPGGRTYVEGTYFEDEEKMEMTVKAFEKGRRTMMQTDIFGQPVKTNRQMFAYKEWFRVEFAKTKSKIINATEGGILKDHCEIMSLAEASEKFLGEKFDAMRIIRDCAAGFEGYDLLPLINGMKENIESIKNCIKTCEKGIARIRETVNALEKMDNISPNWAKTVLKELDSLRFDLMKEPAMNEFISIANQTGVLNFQRAYRVLNGQQFSRVIFRDALDLYTNLFMSTGRTARGVLPFHAVGYKILAGRISSQGGKSEEELCLTSPHP